MDTNGEESRVPVKKVDHIVVTTQDPELLFQVMTEVFELPVAWPLESYSGFTSGGVHLGNVNLETIKFDSQEQASTAGEKARIFGIVFEPLPLDEVLESLSERGVNPGEPVPYPPESEAGGASRMWTIVMLNGLGRESYAVYLCEYEPRIEEALSKVEKENPGPFGEAGITSLKEVVIGCSDLESAMDRWWRLLAPLAPDDANRWKIGDGPAIRLRKDEKDRICCLELGVRELKKAGAFLRRKGLFGGTSGDKISIEPGDLQGLDLLLSED